MDDPEYPQGQEKSMDDEPKKKKEEIDEADDDNYELDEDGNRR